MLLTLVALTGSSIFVTFSQNPTILNFALPGFNNNNAVQSKADPPSILIITNPSNNYFTDWRDVLQAEGFTVTQVLLDTLISNPSVASAFDVLILDTSCESLTQSDAETIAGIGKPVLAVGSGGYEFLNHLGAQITPMIVQETGVHVLSLSTSYNNWDIHYHIVYQYPTQVIYDTNYLYGEVTQRYIMLPLYGDSLILTNSPSLIPLAKDITKGDNYFLSIYNNYQDNHYLVHWALNNITSISQDSYGESCLQTLINTLYWLNNKNPYSVRIVPDSYEYNSSEVVNVSITAVDNLYQTLHGGITLDVNITDENQNTVHTDQLVTSDSGPVYTSFQIPSVPSPSYTINVTDGSLFFIEVFTVQPTDYQITEFSATPDTIYLGMGEILLNACVKVDGNPASGVVVRWSIVNRVIYPGASFVDNPNLYTLLGYRATNDSGYAAYQWVPEVPGVYEVVAWIRNYDGLPKNWTATQVTVQIKSELSLNLIDTNAGITYIGDTVRVEGYLTLNSQPVESGTSINVTIYDPISRVVNYVIFTDSYGRFSLDWIPSIEGIYTIFCTYAGNLTVDSVTKGVEFSVYRLRPGLETSAKDGVIAFGNSLQITANFSSLSFTPKLGEPVTLLVMDLDNNIVFLEEYTVNNLEYFQTQWTPQNLGEYKILLCFNQSYTVISTSSTIIVASSAGGFDSSPKSLLSLSLSDITNSDYSAPVVLIVMGSGLLGSIVLFTRLKKNGRTGAFLEDWQRGESAEGEEEETEDDES